MNKLFLVPSFIVALSSCGSAYVSSEKKAFMAGISKKRKEGTLNTIEATSFDETSLFKKWFIDKKDLDQKIAKKLDQEMKKILSSSVAENIKAEQLKKLEHKISKIKAFSGMKSYEFNKDNTMTAVFDCGAVDARAKSKVSISDGRIEVLFDAFDRVALGEYQNKSDAFGYSDCVSQLKKGNTFKYKFLSAGIMQMAFVVDGSDKSQITWFKFKSRKTIGVK